MTLVAPSLLTDLPRAVADTLAAAIPGLRTCEPRAGRFTLDELKKLGKPAPAVFVSILSGRGGTVYAGPQHTIDLSMAAYVVTKDAAGLPRDVAAQNLCLALLQQIPDRRWGLDVVGEAREPGLQSLVTEGLRDVGASLWAVTWVQPVLLTGWEAALPIPLQLYVAEYPEVGEVPFYTEVTP